MAAPRFEILMGTIVIGYSELEGGDPPMGVASGILLPLPAYTAIQQEVVASREDMRQHPLLKVRHVNGLEIPTLGVHIEDYSASLGAEGIEVSALGIAYPLYEELFPGRYAEYVEYMSNPRVRRGSP